MYVLNRITIESIHPPGECQFAGGIDERKTIMLNVMPQGEIDDETVIWRYIRLSQLIEILEGCLWFTSLASFEDQEEGNWYRLDGVGTSGLARQIYVSCWCEDDVDLEYMWHRPSKPELAIRTTHWGFEISIRPFRVGERSLVLWSRQIHSRACNSTQTVIYTI